MQGRSLHDSLPLKNMDYLILPFAKIDPSHDAYFATYKPPTANKVTQFWMLRTGHGTKERMIHKFSKTDGHGISTCGLSHWPCIPTLKKAKGAQKEDFWYLDDIILPIVFDVSWTKTRALPCPCFVLTWNPWKVKRCAFSLSWGILLLTAFKLERHKV